ncbi:LIM/homeobox protein Lhx9 [Anopheles stephensi]|uniref:LIM/homeobox protein Lhx9 n=1 Tax=Anopheles stephensi TaxID=30069 RepID=UPI001658721E|nr:LIM/homeobox protein Lhx9 [Anopheles stephensi]XP_035919434.1 LIM/homeobox protein Lhx9 [Anopheles stephensi]XP_035919435.1 LIM/homeobox protein Lhx9 [Anopheles stephensi]XP_035919436.1 LIM/homeobox protein Lhx9 [Anopheles stephensi]
MMTMDVTKPEPPSATAGMGGGNTGTMSLGGMIPTNSQQQQQAQQQQQQQQQQQPNTLNNQSVAGGGPAGGGGGGGGGGPPHQQQQLCAGCGKHIQDRFLLRALDLLWHEDCLKCGCCDCRLGEVGSTLYTKGNLMLCKRDYLRLFGNTGFCAACNKVIPAFEMVMRARNNVYHLECFACQQCNHRFCVGDKFYLCENKILCEYDYEERLVFASMANHPMLKRQISQGGGPVMQNGHGGGGGVNGGPQMQAGQGQGMGGIPSPQQNGGANGANLMGLVGQRNTGTGGAVGGGGGGGGGGETKGWYFIFTKSQHIWEAYD